MIKNSDGQIALRHYNSNPEVVSIGGKIFRFVPKYNVSLGYVDEENLQYVLSLMANLCCNQRKAKFVLANQNDVSIWETGHLP